MNKVRFSPQTIRRTFNTATEPQATPERSEGNLLRDRPISRFRAGEALVRDQNSGCEPRHTQQVWRGEYTDFEPKPEQGREGMDFLDSLSGFLDEKR